MAVTPSPVYLEVGSNNTYGATYAYSSNGVNWQFVPRQPVHYKLYSVTGEVIRAFTDYATAIRAESVMGDGVHSSTRQGSGVFGRSNFGVGVNAVTDVGLALNAEAKAGIAARIWRDSKDAPHAVLYCEQLNPWNTKPVVDITQAGPGTGLVVVAPQGVPAQFIDDFGEVRIDDGKVFAKGGFLVPSLAPTTRCS